MAQMGSLVVSLELQQEQFQRGMDQAARQLAKAQQAAKKAETAFSGLQQGMKAVGQAAAAVGTAMAAMRGVEAIVRAADQLKNLQGSFSALLGDAGRAADMMQRVFGVVDRTGAPLEAVGASMQRLTIAMGALGASNRQIETVTETFLQLGKVGGSSAAETASALQQLGQALASGKLGGDELKSIRENAPLVAEAIAQAIGVTSGQLKQLGEDGKLTSDVVANALIKASDQASAAFAKMPQSFEQAVNRMDAQTTRFLAKFDEASGLSRNLVTVTDAVAANIARWTAELENANGKLTPIGAVASALDQSFRVIAGVVAAINFQLELTIRAVTTLVLLAGDVGTGFKNVGAIMADFSAQTGKAVADLVAFEQRLAGVAKTASAAQARAAARGDELRPPDATLKPPPGSAGAGKGGGKSDAEKEAEQLRKRGEALAAAVDPLNAYNQKLAEYTELLNKAAISDVTFARAVEQAKEALTAQGDALTASVDPAFAFELAMRKINQAYRDGAIEVEIWIKLMEEAKSKMDEALKKPKTEMEKLTESATEAIGGGVGDFFSSILTGAETADKAFEKMVKSIISQLAKLLAEFAAAQAAKFIISSLFGGTTGAPGDKSAAPASLMLASRPPTFNAAATLGPSTRAGEPAAVTGGVASGSSGGPWNVVVNNNAPATDVSTRTGPDGALEITVERVRQALAQDVVRGGNQFSRSMELAYGLGARPMTSSADLKRVYASAPSDRRYIDTLELWHPLFPTRYYLVNDVQGWQFLLSATEAFPTQFLPIPFKVVMPTSDGKGQQDMQVQIDNVGREAMDAIEAASAMPTVNITTTFRVYLDVANTAPHNDPPLVLALQSITVDAGAIVGVATRADVLNRPFPTELYRVDLFPGLNR